jgi:hypothetical protein
MLGGVVPLFLERVALLLEGVDQGCQGLQTRGQRLKSGLRFGWGPFPHLVREGRRCVHGDRVRHEQP